MDRLPVAIEGVAILGVMFLVVSWYRRAPGLTAIGAGLFATIALGLYVAGFVTHDPAMLWGAFFALMGSCLFIQVRTLREFVTGKAFFPGDDDGP